MSDPAAGSPGPELSPPSPRPSDRRYRSSMLPRFGLLYWLTGLWLFLRRLRLEEHSAENIRQAAERGPIVYCLHTRSRLDWLALNRVLNSRRLPLARFSMGIRSTWLRPVWEAVADIYNSLQQRYRSGGVPDALASGWLTEAVAEGLPTCVFLTQPWDPADLLRGPEPDAIESLIRAQARSQRPIQVVPVVVAWHRRPETVPTEVERKLLGSEDEPSPLQKLFAVLTRESVALVQAGKPVDLSEVLQRYSSEGVDRQARVARLLLRRYLYRESHVIRGPQVRPYGWMRRLVIQDPRVQQMIREEAAAAGRSELELHREVRGVLDRMMARVSYSWLRAARVFVGFIFNRIFAGIDIRPSDAECLRAAVRAGTPVLVPCHRSHLDYLLLSYVMFQHNIVVPHVVAGDNLAFWPMGFIFRRMGGFFIKRSFKNDRIFPVVFQAYLRQLIHDGFPVEFFVEGGRSRTGRLLPPKPGVLGMVLDAADEASRDRDVTLLPIGISYEQIAEEESYVREISGGQKQKEDIGQVVRAGKVLGQRYGRVYLRVGEPVSCREVVQGAPGGWSSMDRHQRQEAVLRVGEQIMFRIGRSIVMLPTGLVALSLMAQNRRGIREAELMERVARLEGLLQRCGAVPAAALGQRRDWVLQQALRRFEQGRIITRMRDHSEDILVVVEEKRVNLEYYKNTLLHFVAPVSMLCMAVRALREQSPLPEAELLAQFRALSLLLKSEFILDPDQSTEEHYQRALEELLLYGALQRGPEGLRVLDPRRVTELGELIRNFLECYDLCLRGLRALEERRAPAAELPRLILDFGRGLLAVGELQRSEALSLPALQSALQVLQEDGLVQPQGASLRVEEGAGEARLMMLRRMMD